MRENWVIQEWCNEVTKPVSITKDTKTKTITLYTEWPGWYIGKGGTIFYKYEEKLKKMGWDQIKIVELKETFQPGNNYDDIVEERVNAFWEAEKEWIKN